MNKTIKIIDLYNRIAKGEEVPKKIKYNNVIYEFNIDFGYINKNNYGADDYLLEDVNGNTIELNNEVEIIEESEQDIDIQAIEEVNHYSVISAIKGKTEKNINDELDVYSFAINELVRAVKQLDNKIKEK